MIYGGKKEIFVDINTKQEAQFEKTNKKMF